jgi:hypothetical protein
VWGRGDMRVVCAGGEGEGDKQGNTSIQCKCRKEGSAVVKAMSQIDDDCRRWVQEKRKAGAIYACFG